MDKNEPPKLKLVSSNNGAKSSPESASNDDVPKPTPILTLDSDMRAALEIVMYFHCGKCLKEKPPDKSPQEWGMNEVGATEKGLQVWCRRHDCNVGLFELALRP